MQLPLDVVGRPADLADERASSGQPDVVEVDRRRSGGSGRPTAAA